MSYRSAPNTPIPLGDIETIDGNDCGCGDDNYSQQVDRNDQLFIQLISEPCDDAYTLNEPTIQAWTESYGIVCADEADGSGFYSFTFNANYPYGVYKVVITVESITSGQLSINLQGSDTQYITSAGTYELYFNTSVVVGGDFTPSITVSGGTFVGCFNSAIEVYGIPTETRIAFVSPDGTTYDELASRLIEVVDNVITIVVDVFTQALQDGCYRIGIADFCTNSCSQFRLDNGFFTEGQSGWIKSDPIKGWVLGDREATCEILSDDEDTYGIENTSPLCDGVTYNIQLSDVSITTGQYRIVAGDTVSSWLSSDGEISLSITASGTEPIYLTIECRANQTGGVGVGVFMSLSSIQISPIDTDVTFDLFSPQISIGSFTSCKDNGGVESFKLEGCNADNQFGMTFSGIEFVPGVRFAGRFFRAQYDTDVDLFRFSSGRRITAYADIAKRKTLYIHQQPEYVFDFLSKLIYFDSIYINGTAHAPVEEDFPDIEWNDANSLGSCEIEFYVREEKITKVDCSGATAGCLPTVAPPPTNLLLQDNTNLLLQNNDTLLLQGN